MTLKARQINADHRIPPSWFKVQHGEPFEGFFEIIESRRSAPTRLDGSEFRFRIYSQIVDRQVLIELCDSARNTLCDDGIWHLTLNASETERLPCGGMRFTLELRDQNGQYHLAIDGGVSCVKPKSQPAALA